MGKLGRCRGRTKKGKPCRAAATTGGLCFFHTNPNKAAELGRIGGRSNRRPVPASVDPLPRLDNAKAVRDTADRLIADVYSGKVEPRIASSLAPLLNLQLRAVETTDLVRRIVELEKRAAEADRAGTSNGEGEAPSRGFGDPATRATHQA